GVGGRGGAGVCAGGGRAGGGGVAAELYSPKPATTFIQSVKQVAALKPDALFTPANAAQLELIAAHLAAAGVTNMPGVRSRAKTARLYASADGLSERIVAASAKYLTGAVLAPVFAPDRSNQLIASFIQRYQTPFPHD